MKINHTYSDKIFNYTSKIFGEKPNMIERLKIKIKDYGEKYQIDFIYLIENEFWVYLKQSIFLITGLATYIAFARLTSKDIFGQFNYFQAIMAIFVLFSIPGLNNSVLRSVARGYEGSYTNAVKISFLWSLLGIPALIGVGAYYYYYNTKIIGVCLLLSSIFFPFLYAPNTWESFFQGKKRFDVMAKYGSIRSIIIAAIMIITIYLYPESLIIIISAYLFINVFLVWILFSKSLKYIENDVQDNECQGYGYFLTTTNIIGTLAKNIDKILIGSLFGPSELAIYSIATVIPLQIGDLMKASFTPVLPKFSQDEIGMDQIFQKIKSLILPLLFMILGGSLLYWTFIDNVILIMFGEEYTDAIIYSKILIVMLIVTIPDMFLGFLVIAKKNTSAIVGGYHIFPFVKLLITIVFIYLWGMMGAVWGLCFAPIAQILLFLVGMRSKSISRGNCDEII